MLIAYPALNIVKCAVNTGKGAAVMETGSFKRDGYLREDFRFFHLRDKLGQEKDYHFHEFDKLVFPLAGRVAYEVETSVYALRPGDVLLVRHHVIHKAVIDVTVPYERIILYIDGRYVDRLGTSDRLMTCFDRTDAPGRHRLTPDTAGGRRIGEILASLERAAADEGFGAASMRTALLMQLLVELGRLAPAAESPAQDAPATNDKIESTLSYINENLGAELSVEELAARVYLSRYHFMRLFKEQTGTAVHAYIRKKRLLLAAKRIRGGEPLGVVAEESGYSDYSAFYRAFRDCFGASPGDIKK